MHYYPEEDVSLCGLTDSNFPFGDLLVATYPNSASINSGSTLISQHIQKKKVTFMHNPKNMNTIIEP